MPLIAGEIAASSFKHGTVYVSADFRGSALWLPPGEHVNGDVLERILHETVEPSRLDDMLQTVEQMEGAHPQEAHWYLPFIGVEPTAQGKGLGGELMHHAVARCDESGALAYLESSNPRNIPLYLRHGFEVIGKIQVGAGPVVTPMLRRPH
jgi:ribosomal protein S18 acetylase RimI-like enzyme